MDNSNTGALSKLVETATKYKLYVCILVLVVIAIIYFYCRCKTAATRRARAKLADPEDAFDELIESIHRKQKGRKCK